METFKLFTESVELKVGHVRHVLKDVVGIGVTVLWLPHDFARHLSEDVVLVHGADEKRVIRDFAELHEDV